MIPERILIQTLIGRVVADDIVLVIFGYQSIDWYCTFNLWTFYFYFWEGKKREKPLEIRSGGWFRKGKVWRTLNDYGIP